MKTAKAIVMSVVKSNMFAIFWLAPLHPKVAAQTAIHRIYALVKKNQSRSCNQYYKYPYHSRTVSNHGFGMPFSLIPFLLIAIPISEIAVFILIGGQIGVLWTLALILVTAIMGSILLRIQGFQVLARLRSDIDAGRIPGKDLGHGAMILAAGLLLLTPGFVTDTIGFLFFVPAIRSSIWNFLSARVRIIGAGPSQGVDSGAHREGQHRSAQDADVVDLDPDDFKRRDDSPNPNSPWRSGESVSISQPDNSREPGGTRSS